jgi:uncharacterized protein YndB with AHSA1/START domain
MDGEFQSTGAGIATPDIGECIPAAAEPGQARAVLFILHYIIQAIYYRRVICFSGRGRGMNLLALVVITALLMGNSVAGQTQETQGQEKQKPPAKVNIVVRRLIDAPPGRVWKAWTDANEVKRWWGPTGYTSPTCVIDLKEGGKYIFAMQAPPEQGGHTMYVAGTYGKIVKTTLLEFTQTMADKEGNPLKPSATGMSADFPEGIRTTVELKAYRAGMTELIVTEYDWAPGQMFVYSMAGLHETVDKLIQYLK